MPINFRFNVGAHISILAKRFLHTLGRKLSVEDIHIPRCVEVKPVMSERRVAEMAEKMRKRSIERGANFPNARNDKALNNQGFVV